MRFSWLYKLYTPCRCSGSGCKEAFETHRAPRDFTRD